MVARIRWSIVLVGALAAGAARAEPAVPDLTARGWRADGGAPSRRTPGALAQTGGDYGGVSAPARQNPVLTVAEAGAYGGVFGLLAGAGASLIEQDHYGRDILIGAGLGLIFGAAFGVVQVVRASQVADGSAPHAPPQPYARVAWDGLGRTARDPVIRARAVGLAVRF